MLVCGAITYLYLIYQKSLIKNVDVIKLEKIITELNGYYYSLETENPRWPVNTILELNYVNFENIEGKDIPNDYYRLYNCVKNQLMKMKKEHRSPIDLTYLKNFSDLLDRIQERIDE